MLIKASLKNLRIAPRKMRIVADLIRNKSVSYAENQLKFSDKKSANLLLKLLRSAKANAKHNFNIENKDLLYIKEVRVDEGPHSLKRWQPRAMGRAYPILKRTSHINLILEAKGVELKKSKKKSNIKTIKTNISSKIVKEKSKNILKESIMDENKKDRIASENNVDKGHVPEKPYGSSGASKKRFFSRQWKGSLSKKFFRRKNV